MAKRRKRRAVKRHTAVAAAPRRRRRRHHLSTAPRRKGRKRHRAGLSELGITKALGMPVTMSKYVDPIVEGGMGGGAAKLAVKLIPQKFLDQPNIKPHANLVKGLMLLAGAGVAAGMKQPLIAAGMSGAAVYKFMEAEGILSDDDDDCERGVSSRGNFRQVSFANPRLLQDGRLLSDSRLLTEGQNIYPPYDPLYESPRDEFRY